MLVVATVDGDATLIDEGRLIPGVSVGVGEDGGLLGNPLVLLLRLVEDALILLILLLLALALPRMDALGS